MLHKLINFLFYFMKLLFKTSVILPEFDLIDNIQKFLLPTTTSITQDVLPMRRDKFLPVGIIMTILFMRNS